MHISVFVQGLRILHVASERVEAVELAIGRVVPAGSEVLLLGLGVEVLAAVAEAGQRGCCRYGCADCVVQSEQLAVCGEGEAGGPRTFNQIEKDQLAIAI